MAVMVELIDFAGECCRGHQRGKPWLIAWRCIETTAKLETTLYGRNTRSSAVAYSRVLSCVRLPSFHNCGDDIWREASQRSKLSEASPASVEFSRHFEARLQTRSGISDLSRSLYAR